MYSPQKYHEALKELNLTEEQTAELLNSLILLVDGVLSKKYRMKETGDGAG